MEKNKVQKLNVIRSPADNRDWKASAIYRTVPLPEEVDYRNMMFPIRDQGDQGSCAAMAGSSMKEWQERVEINFDDYMSPQFIYNNREDKTEEGMFMRDLMIILKEKGVCPEKLFPYGTLGFPSNEVYVQASIYKTLNYAFVDTLLALKTSIYINGPCIIAIPVYNFSERMWYRYPGDDYLGGHALCIVGYNKEGIIIRNSWGTEWGDEGYCTMKYEDFGLQWEIWTTIDAKSFDPPIDPPVPDHEPSKKGCLGMFF